VIFNTVVWHRCCVILELVSVFVFIAVCKRMSIHTPQSCVSLERVDYLSYFSSVVCIESGLYCVLELYLHCGAVLV